LVNFVVKKFFVGRWKLKFEKGLEMKQKLMVLYSLILIGIVWATAWASLRGNVFDGAVQLWAIPWGRATFFDTYFAFLTIYLWMASREKTWASRVLWFVLVMALGNIAIASYMLLRLARLGDKDPLKELLLGKK